MIGSNTKNLVQLFNLNTYTRHEFHGYPQAVAITGLSVCSVRNLFYGKRQRVKDWCRIDAIPQGCKPKSEPIGTTLKVRSTITNRRHRFATNEDMMEVLGLTLQEVILIRYGLVDSLKGWTADV